MCTKTNSYKPSNFKDINTSVCNIFINILNLEKLKEVSILSKLKSINVSKGNYQKITDEVLCTKANILFNNRLFLLFRLIYLYKYDKSCKRKIPHIEDRINNLIIVIKDTIKTNSFLEISENDIIYIINEVFLSD